MAGLTDTGFEQKTLDTIKTELEDAFKGAFGDSIDVSPQEPFGQIIGVMAEREAELWDLAAATYRAMTPDSAIGLSLDEVCGLTGTIRLAAATSTVTITATGTAGTVLVAGRVVTVQTIGTRFLTLADATITAVSAWTAGHGYTAGDRVANGSRVYQCTISGTSAGSGGPTGTGSAITDNTATWEYLGDGTGAIDIAAESEDTGPKVAASRTLTTIGSPQSGWSTVTNLLDADLGHDLEKDAPLRIRREDELRANGESALDAIRADILAVSGVTACTVFDNPTDTTDGAGVPPHAVEVLVRGGADAAIAAALFATVAGGIRTYGGVTQSVTDSAGNAHTMQFSRPTEKDIWIIVNATVDASTWPSDGPAQVKDAIVAWGDLQRTGKDAVASAIIAQAFAVTGLLDATALIGLVNPPVASTTVAIGSRELAFYDTSRISVIVTPGTP